jgi:drug/metabolite transporter (DMT)-like permease
VTESANPFATLLYAFAFGALVLLPLQFFTPQPWPVPSSTWLSFAALIVVSTVTPFSVYTFALGRLPASVASILAMAEIPIVAGYAYFLLNERLTAGQILGATLVVGGVLLLSWRRWPARDGGRTTAGD